MAKTKAKMNELIINEFIEYSKWTIETSIHRTREDAITCSILGLVGEGYEYEEKLLTSPGDVEGIQAELGDICYYLGLFVNRTNMYDRLAIKEVLDEDVIDGGMPRVTARLAEAFKKVIRDDHYELVGSRKEQEVYDHVNNLLTLIVSEHDIDEMDFLETLSLNREKLESRKQRGVIKGDGDTR